MQEQLDRIEAKLDLLIDLMIEEEEDRPTGASLDDEAMDCREHDGL